MTKHQADKNLPTVDYEVEAVPHSAFILNTPRTPSCVHKVTPVLKNKLHFQLKPINEERSSDDIDVIDNCTGGNTGENRTSTLSSTSTSSSLKKLPVKNGRQF